MHTNVLFTIFIFSLCAYTFKLDTTETLEFSGQVGTYNIHARDNLSPASVMWCFIKLNCTADAFLMSAANGIKRSVEGKKRALQSRKTFFWTEMVDLHETEYALEFHSPEANGCRADMMCEQGNAVSLESSVIGNDKEMFRFRPPAEITNFYAIIESRPHTEFGGGKVEVSYLFENDPILKTKRAPDCYTSRKKVFEVQLFDASNVLIWIEPDSSFALTLSASLPRECTPVVNEEEFLRREAEILQQASPTGSSGLSSAGVIVLATVVPLFSILLCYAYYLHRNEKKSRIAFDYPHWASNFLVWADFDHKSEL